MGTVKAIKFGEEEENEFRMASSCPIPAPVTQVIATSPTDKRNNQQPLSENGDDQADGDKQGQENGGQTYQDFHEQFLNNHISTIEEDFEGENMTSEFSTQRTQNKD